ncbi:PREDICTED: uncharacterized protein LOC105366846 [Ceratosolen solmsi marchali]|uniref:Uncharacterized protein LOC105366846 n=1 Tax=Ceratosolen solmsi marchali TaxID=326594 RepID=A0AAJ7E107_9HYME|nr:PREDICTED: uncharacterized protein LOC105366846 [Ceratosolen solmsi marchali]
MATFLNNNNDATINIQSSEVVLESTSTAASTAVLLGSEVSTNSLELAPQQQQQTIDMSSEVTTAGKIVSGNLKINLPTLFSMPEAAIRYMRTYVGIGTGTIHAAYVSV